VVTSRMSWPGEDAWVKISDNVNTALTADSSALTSGTGYPGS
jgi:hypothetical protein